ncbi:uncharacterized protein LOC135400801 [Ornithodoros turicata]|uniref:uncharacterized protein LOC135400801 n=1 Tax=Ornithodoros turicata TaxID=34597 RepID=UPI003139E886
MKTNLVTVLLMASCVVALDLNPLNLAGDLTGDLAANAVDLLDAVKCLQTPRTYYGYYRSHLDDPVLVEDMCFMAKQLGPPENGTVAFGGGYLRNGNVVKRPRVVTELCSIPGTNIINCLRMPIEDSPDSEFEQLNFLYFVCGNCVVIGTPQIADNACVLRVTDPNNVDPSCELAYDSLCGTEKFSIYDEDICRDVYLELQE